MVDDLRSSGERVLGRSSEFSLRADGCPDRRNLWWVNRGFRTETGNALDPRTASSDGDHEDLVEGSITDRFEGIGDDDVDEDDE